MIDFLGNEIKVGDEVVCIEWGYKNLTKGKVVKVTPKTCQVEYSKQNYLREVKRLDQQVIRINNASNS